MSNAQDTPLQIPVGKVPLDYLMYMREIPSKRLADETGVSTAEVSRWRRGMRPREESRKRAAKFLKVSQVDLGWESADV